MNKDIKAIIKAAANKQEINDLTDKIIASVDTSKIEYSRESIKAPKRKFNFFPLMIAGLATAVLVVTISISIGIMNNNNSNTVDPNLPTDPIVEYEEITLNKLESFYAQFTVEDAPNMINIVNTFNNVSFVNPENVQPGNLSVEMEESVVNDVNLFVYNIEDMLGYLNTSSTLVASTNPDYIYLINVLNNNYNYQIFYNETLIEEKNVDKSNYKYKAELTGKVVSGNNEYSFTGEKRIKNSKLIYTTVITLAEDKKVSVEEYFTINQDFTINYKEFEFRYLYQYGDDSKNARITQKFDENQATKEILFRANENAFNEVKLTIKPQADYYIRASISSRNDDLYISKANNEYTYKFKNSNNEYKK